MIRTPCIEYAGGKRNSDGYGSEWRGGKSHAAHRLAYCDANGVTIESIAGKVVRHTCDNPPCINPKHLILGTQKENMQDKHERGRANTARGLSLPHTTAADVELQVRALLSDGITHREIARRLNISAATVSRIRNR